MATKRSAAASLVKVGIFFFIALDLLRLHVPGAERADEPCSVARPDREDEEHAPPFLRFPSRSHARLGVRRRRSGQEHQRAREEIFNLRNRNAMPLAFVPVASISLNPRRLPPIPFLHRPISTTQMYIQMSTVNVRAEES